MKRGIAVTALLFSLVGIAGVQSQDLRQSAKAPLGTAIFYVLIAGASEAYTPGYWVARFEGEALTLDEDRKLWDQARRARAENLEFQYAEQKKLCANRDALTTVEAVAAALGKFDADNEANIETLGNKAVKTLGDRLGKLLTAAASRSMTTVVATDHKKVMETRKREPGAYIGAFCSR